MLISINPINPQTRLVRSVVDVLRRGGIVAYPTDTVYGVGCDIMNKKAIEKVYQLKQRHKSKPFSFICSDLKHISHYAKVSNYAYKTMRRLLPGPYTFILEGSRLVPKIMLTKRKTVGIRVPDNEISLAIVRTLGRPIISTSAGLDDPYTIKDAFGQQLDLIIDGGPLYPNPSSVISLIGDVPEVIREGKGDIRSFL